MAIRIGSNISSLQAQRRLSEASSTLSKTYERLSSGQRINRASDDAAGLSIADSLKAGGRVFTQGVRNLNDGISLLQIADSAVSNLSQIVTRVRELAEQAANGSYSSAQRKAMDKEAKELEKEYFRIARSASFNGTNLFDGSLSQGLRLQGGFGLEGSIQSSLGGVMGDGTFTEKTAFTAGEAVASLAVGDLNQDGISDLVAANSNSDTVGIYIGNGDGTYSSPTYCSTGNAPNDVVLGDLNGDGALDMVTVDGIDDTASVFIGKGDGSFSAKVSYTTGNNPFAVTLGDLNGDGILDMVTTDTLDHAVSVFIGKGDGTFFSRVTYAAGDIPKGVTLGDLNGDGVLDMVTANGTDNTATVLIGRGDGTFSAGAAYSTGLDTRSVALGDLNGDGVLDLITADFGAYNGQGSTISVLMGKGDGTFSQKTSYSTGLGSQSVALGDVNGDGMSDIITADSGNQYGVGGTVGVFLGLGNGTFASRASISIGCSTCVLGDADGDGVLDIVTEDSTDRVSILLGNTRDGIAPLLPFSLTTQSDALQAMAPLDRKLSQLAAQRGVIGAFQSRLSVAVNTLQSTSENYAAAESRIRDADIASESAELVRLQISQQAATSILAQANQAPALAVQLLRGS